MKKKLLFLFSVMLAFLVIPTNAYASDAATDVITYDEYVSAVTEEYAKYGVDYKVLEGPDDDVVFTQDMLNERLAQVRQEQTSRLVSNGAARSVVGVSSSVEDGVGANGIEPRIAMPVTKNFDYTQRFSPVPGAAWADICLRLNGTYDVQYADPWSINSVQSFQKGGYLNFVSWTQLSSGGSMGAHSFTGWATGLLAVEYTEPNTGLLVGYTEEYTISHTWTNLTQ